MAQKKVLEKPPKEKERTITITENEFEEHLRKMSRALHGIRALLDADPAGVDACDVAAEVTMARKTVIEISSKENPDSRSIRFTNDDLSRLRPLGEFFSCLYEKLINSSDSDDRSLGAIMAPAAEQLSRFCEEIDERFQTEGGAQ